MVARLKEIYRTNTIVSSIFFVGGTQASILDTTYQERIPPVLASAALYCIDSILMYWNTGYNLVINNITIVKMGSYEGFSNDQ